MLDLYKTLRFTETLAREVGDKLLIDQPGVSVVAYKDRQDVVTTAELAAKSVIITLIKKRFPEHSIFSEEQGSDQKDSDYQWIIDPLDGTKEYLRRLPFWNTNISLEYQQLPILSVIYRPVQKSLLSAAKDVGWFENGQTTTISKVTQLSEANIYAYIPSQSSKNDANPGAWRYLEQLAQNTYRVRGSAEEAVSIAWVGVGKIEAAINMCRFPKWYDFVAGFVIAQTAGCIITDLDNRPIAKNGKYSGYIVSNSPLLHRQIIATIGS